MLGQLISLAPKSEEMVLTRKFSTPIFASTLLQLMLFSIAFDHTDFIGLFNLTKPGQEDRGIKTHLDDFTLDVSVKEVEVRNF